MYFSATVGHLFFIVLHTAVECTLLHNANDGPIVHTKLGAIRGVRADDGNYTMFLGIPYARVNKSNVFGNSIPNPVFQGEFQAKDDSSICPQIEEFNKTIVGSLDCLHLNIYVPDSATSRNVPVMVYILGGDFVLGFAGRFLFGPQFLVRHDVILVTFNYRLGPYGFMCLNTPEVPGNAGLKDQVSALRWVKENIGSFGGDKDKVTIFGNSVGSISVGIHLTSENENLFSSAILQSGSAYSAKLITKCDPSSIFQLSTAVGFQTNDVNAAIRYLSDLDPHQLIETTASLKSIQWKPCIEKKFNGIERFMSTRAINSDHSKARNISILLGYTNNEGMSYSPEFKKIKPELPAKWHHIFATVLQENFNFNGKQLADLSSLVRRFYIGDMEINYEEKYAIANFMGDTNMYFPVIRSLKSFLEAGTTNIFQYLFSYGGQRNFIKFKSGITEPGAVHADELGYLFNMNFIPQDPVPEDQLIIDRMTVMWTNFAKYGDPTPQVTTLLPVKWKPVTKSSPYHYINIDTNMTTGTRYEHRRMSFWELFYKAYKEYEVGYIAPNHEDNKNTSDGDDDVKGVTDSACLALFSPALIVVLVLKLIL